MTDKMEILARLETIARALSGWAETAKDTNPMGETIATLSETILDLLGELRTQEVCAGAGLTPGKGPGLEEAWMAASPTERGAFLSSFALIRIEDR